MRILADACVGATLVQAIRAGGFDIAYAAEGPPRVPDESILDWARRDQRILLTEDHDFGALTLRDRIGAPGVILVELHGLSADAKIRRVLSALRDAPDEFAGAFTVVEPARIRRRPLTPEA